MEHQNIRIAVDQAQLAVILEAFYTVSHIKSTLFDTDFNEILTYPQGPSEFCRIVRSHHLDRCKKSDRLAFMKCRKEGTTIGYCSHIGLYEVISPLRNGDEVIGYIMFGQMIQKESKEKIIKEIQKQYRYLEEGPVLEEALGKLEERSSEEIQAATMLMQTCICYLLSNRIVRVNRGNFVEELNAYIENHISQEITADNLCKYFGVSRSALYLLAEQCLEGGVMKYIRNVRIEKAKKLLTGTQKQITEIASLVGFTDYNYFLRVFNVRRGCPAGHIGNGGRRLPLCAVEKRLP